MLDNIEGVNTKNGQHWAHKTQHEDKQAKTPLYGQTKHK